MRSRAILDWLAFVVVVVVCVAAAYGAYTLANYSWNGVVDYASPYAALKVPQAASGTQLATTTVLVIIDGLGDATSRQLDGLQRLRQYGTDLTLLAPQPSLSFPDWTTLLSGDPPYVSGVTTNWFTGKVPVETLLDSARTAGVSTVVVGPEEMAELYGADKATASFLRSYPTTFYASTGLVDQAVALIQHVKPRLAVLHLPDVDNAGHRSGGSSSDYLNTAKKVDADIERLVQALQGSVVFVITADHGHIDSGGHGGGESVVVEVPGVLFGEGVALGRADAAQEDVAPTVAVLAGIPVPRFSKGEVLESVLASAGAEQLRPAWSERLRFADDYVAYVLGPTGQTSDVRFAEDAHGAAVTQFMNDADATRLAFDRQSRLWSGLAAVAVCLAVLAAIGLVSWRALVAALAGTLTYYAVYNLLYFVVHGYGWSLSAFNEETMVRAFFNGRMVEAAVATLIAAAVGAFVYPWFRAHAQGPSGSYLSRWLTLGPVTALTILATLGIQVAVFVWGWGVTPTWNLPNLFWGFKYDLDLIQATAVGAVAIVASLLTYLIGRYHPKTRRLPAKTLSAAGEPRVSSAEE